MKATHKLVGHPTIEYNKNEATGEVFFRINGGDWLESAFTRLSLFDIMAVKINPFKGNK